MSMFRIPEGIVILRPDDAIDKYLESGNAAHTVNILRYGSCRAKVWGRVRVGQSSTEAFPPYALGCCYIHGNAR